MSNLFSDTLGKFFVIYSRMVYHQKRSNFFEESLKRIKSLDEPQPDDDNKIFDQVFKNEDTYTAHRDAVVNEIQKEIDEVMKQNFDLK